MPARTTLSTTERGYGRGHQTTRARFSRLVLAGGVRCARCRRPIRPGEPWDLGHADGDRSRYSGPEHRRCNRATASRRVVEWKPAPPELEPERDGLDPGDERWDVPWLKGLRKVPKDAVWPRLMTVPHPRAVDSLGPEVVKAAVQRSGIRLRWWQKLVAARVLEVDAAGELVWETVVWSMARQLGKSWLLRELLLWRDPPGRALRRAAGRDAHRQGRGDLQGDPAPGPGLGEGPARRLQGDRGQRPGADRAPGATARAG